MGRKKKLGVTKKQNFIFNEGNVLFAFRTKKGTSKHKGGDFVGFANPLKMSIPQALGFKKRPKGSFNMKNLLTGR